MNDDSLAQLFSFNLSLNSENKLEFPEEKFAELYRKGFREVKISVSGNIFEAAELTGVDPESLKQICEIQGLPTNVVFDFLNAKGSLKNTNFETRIRY